MEQLADERTGHPLDPEKVREAREEKMRELEERVCVTVDGKKCRGKTGKPPVGARWIDVCKSDGTHMSRLAAKDCSPKSRVGDKEGAVRNDAPF